MLCECGVEFRSDALDLAIEANLPLYCYDCGKVHTAEQIKNAVAQKRARHDHPETSHIAARKLTAAYLKDAHLKALKFVKLAPGKTARELQQIAQEADSRTIGRRLNELADAGDGMGLIRRGPARPCSITKRLATTWYPVTPEDKDE